MPVLRTIDGRLTDWLFQHGRADPPAPSHDIVHVDIDDSALDSVGRWPWPRMRLAEAIQLMDRMGARVIALDLLLASPQAPQWLEDGTKIDNDAELAKVMRDTKAKVLLAVSGLREYPVWPELDALLRRDITLGSDAIIHALGLTGERALTVRRHVRQLKAKVLRRFATARVMSVAEIRAEVVPADHTLGDFPELRLIERAVDYARARRALHARLDNAGQPQRVLHEVMTPLALITEAADGFGIVAASQDSDGQLRRTRLRWEFDGREFLQLGLAAAHAYRPDLKLPEQDELLLSWPRIDQKRPLAGIARHISLGVVISLVRAQAKLQRDAALHKKSLQELIDREVGGNHDEIVDQAEFWEISDADQLESLDIADIAERDRRRTRNLVRTYLRRHDELERGRKNEKLGRKQLRTELNDKLVFVGWNATAEIADVYPTTLMKRTPGVVVHGIVANMVLTGYVVRDASPVTGAALTLLLGVAAAFAMTRFGPRLALLLVLLTGTAYFAINTIFVFSNSRVSLAMGTPLISLFVAWAGTQVVTALQDRRQKWQLRRQFGTRVSKRLFDYLINNPDDVHLEGEEREVTCFFSDLAGFTSISEQLDSRETVKLLNRYMWAMNDELSRVQAYVNKFLGDGIMAIWGAFSKDAPHSERACLGALACMRRLEQLNTEPEFAGLPDLHMRIGIATGIVTVGDCGAPPDLRDYTVIGDSVNLAARLESASKQFGTKMLINGRCRDLIPDTIFTRPLGSITVVGQKTSAEIHELLAMTNEVTPAQQSLADTTLQAIAHFKSRDFEAAERAWDALDREHGASKLAMLYQDAIAFARANPNEPFDGVLHLDRK